MICKIHNNKLIGDRVENRLGMPSAPPEGYFEARKAFFPHSKMFSIGGCLMPQPDVVRVKYCPDCRAAEREWQSLRDVDDFWRV